MVPKQLDHTISPKELPVSLSINYLSRQASTSVRHGHGIPSLSHTRPVLLIPTSTLLLGILLLASFLALLDFIHLILEVGIGVLVVLVHKVCKVSQPRNCMKEKHIPDKLDSASVNSISSLGSQLRALKPGKVRTFPLQCTNG